MLAPSSIDSPLQQSTKHRWAPIHTRSHRQRSRGIGPVLTGCHAQTDRPVGWNRCCDGFSVLATASGRHCNREVLSEFFSIVMAYLNPQWGRMADVWLGECCNQWMLADGSGVPEALWGAACVVIHMCVYLGLQQRSLRTASRALRKAAPTTINSQDM